MTRLDLLTTSIYQNNRAKLKSTETARAPPPMCAVLSSVAMEKHRKGPGYDFERRASDGHSQVDSGHRRVPSATEIGKILRRSLSDAHVAMLHGHLFLSVRSGRSPGSGAACSCVSTTPQPTWTCLALARFFPRIPG